MTYLTYGPAPTGRYRLVRTPADPELASPLDDIHAAAAPRGRASSTVRAALGVTTAVAYILVAALAAFAVRVVLYGAGHSAGLF